MNPLLAAILPTLVAGLTDLKGVLADIVSNPTLENVAVQEGKLALEALNPNNLEGATLGSAAQEALNVVNSISAHVDTAAAAPSVVVPPVA